MKRIYVKGKRSVALELGRTTITMTEGPIGTPGKPTVIRYKTAEKAAAGWTEKLEATRKAGFKQPRPVERVDAELEAAIQLNPDDDASYAVYADWLQAHELPRGQLAAVQAAIAKLPRGKPADQDYNTSDFPTRETWFDPPRVKGAKALLARQAALLFDHALHPADYDLAELSLREDVGSYARRGARFDWRHGFVRAAWFSHGDGVTDEAIVHALRHPSCRFLRSLTLGGPGYGSYGSKTLAAIAKAVPSTLRSLHVGDFGIGSPEISWVTIGNLAPFYKAAPGLTSLLVQGAEIELGKRIELSKLRRLELRTGGLAGAAVRAIAASSLPELEVLSIWFGDPDYGATATIRDVLPLFDTSRFPKLTHLGLANTDGELGNEIAAAIVGSKLLEQLRVLDLSRGSIDDAGAARLTANKRALAKLDTLDLQDNYLTKTGVRSVKGLAKHVHVQDQREPYDWDDDKRRYASVGE